MLAELDATFEKMYSTSGRPSVPPEQLLKASVLMAMYSMRSERAFCERLNYDMLFKWFLDLASDAPSFDASTFSKNRQRLLDQNIAGEFFAAVVRQAKLRRYMSLDHFSVDGTLLEAWASHKSFKPKDDPSPPAEGPTGRNSDVDFKGQKRSNDTHASTTDPEARLYRKSNNTGARLCYIGHPLIEHRHGLIIDADLTQATGRAERECATDMLKRLPGRGRGRTVAGDKGYDTKDFVADARAAGFTPQVAQNTSNRRSAIDARTTRHPGYEVSQSTQTQTGRGTVRVGQDRRGWTKAALHRSRPKPGLVQNDHRRLQPDPDHRHRHRNRLTNKAGHRRAPAGPKRQVDQSSRATHRAAEPLQMQQPPPASLRTRISSPC